MSIVDILLTGIGLSMDAFTVSICKGLMMDRVSLTKTFIIAYYFGFFQFIMPLLGFFFGNFFASFIINVDHWIAFCLLCVIGFNMIRDSYDDNGNTDIVDFMTMFPLAIATSIDAFTVGITFSFLKVNIYFACIVIGIITFVLSFIGVFIGYRFGYKFHKKSQIFGGFILCLIGLKILIEHLL